jgi:AraC family transcriptional regulator
LEQENIYQQRINLVTNHIRSCLLEDLSLKALADVAGFSPFHFHRIFKSITGETVNALTTRLRLERAVMLLKTTPDLSITEAALECGFNSVSTFSRAFKKQYGRTARSWDRQSQLKNHEKVRVEGDIPTYTNDMLRQMDQQGQFTVQIRSLPTQHLAYIRVINSYAPDRLVNAYETLTAWYQAKGGNHSNTTLIGMSQDDPDVTPLELCRYDICLTIPADWQGTEQVSTRPFPACRIASIHCRGDIFLVDKAWQYLFRYWLPHSRYQPDNLPALEIYKRHPAEIGWETFDLECAIPITNL